MEYPQNVESIYVNIDEDTADTNNEDDNNDDGVTTNGVLDESVGVVVVVYFRNNRLDRLLNEVYGDMVDPPLFPSVKGMVVVVVVVVGTTI